MSDHPAYEGPERRAGVFLTDEQIDHIAEKAAEKVLQSFQQEIGKATIRGLLYLFGAIGLGILSWLGIEKIGGS